MTSQAPMSSCTHTNNFYKIHWHALQSLLCSLNSLDLGEKVCIQKTFQPIVVGLFLKVTCSLILVIFVHFYFLYWLQTLHFFSESKEQRRSMKQRNRDHTGNKPSDGTVTILYIRNDWSQDVLLHLSRSTKITGAQVPCIKWVSTCK